MTSRNFKQSMVNQDQEIIFEVVKASGEWVFPAASSIVEATRGKNMYLRLTDDGRSDIFRLDSVKDGENAGETVFGFVGNGGMDLVELTATTDGTGATTGSWEYAPGEGPAGEAIGNIGKPLQWKGSATVAELNAGITGIQPGWTYTLTDAGTLTDGSVTVEKDDEVAWTEDGEWFKIGGDSGKVEVLQVNRDTGHYVFPTFNDINSLVVTKKKSVCLVQNNSSGSKIVLWLCGRSSGGANQSYKFMSEKGEVLYIYQDGTTKIEYTSALSKSIAPDYSQLTFPIAEGTACMQYGRRYVANTTIATAEDWDYSHWTETSVEDAIGYVETLLNGEGSGEGFRELKFTYLNGLQFVKTHPSTKILSEGFPVDSVDYQLVRTFNGFIYKNITGWKVDGTVTVGLWNYDTKQYVAEVVLSSTSEQSPDTIAALTEATASDEMELHVKGSGTIGAIMGAI